MIGFGSCFIAFHIPGCEQCNQSTDHHSTIEIEWQINSYCNSEYRKSIFTFTSFLNFIQDNDSCSYSHPNVYHCPWQASMEDSPRNAGHQVSLWCLY